MLLVHIDANSHGDTSVADPAIVSHNADGSIILWELGALYVSPSNPRLLAMFALLVEQLTSMKGSYLIIDGFDLLDATRQVQMQETFSCLADHGTRILLLRGGAEQ